MDSEFDVEDWMMAREELLNAQRKVMWAKYELQDALYNFETVPGKNQRDRDAWLYRENSELYDRVHEAEAELLGARTVFDMQECLRKIYLADKYAESGVADE